MTETDFKSCPWCLDVSDCDLEGDCQLGAVGMPGGRRATSTAQDDRADHLERLANDPGVLGASAAAAHTRRGYGHICPDELADVWAALDTWAEAGAIVPIHRLGHQPNVWGELVSALTRYRLAFDRYIRASGVSPSEPSRGER